MSVLFGPKAVTWNQSEYEHKVFDATPTELGGIVPSSSYVAGHGSSDPLHYFSSGVEGAIAIFRQFVAYAAIHHKRKVQYQENLLREFKEEMATLEKVYDTCISLHEQQQALFRTAFVMLFSAYKEARLVRRDTPCFAKCFVRLLRRNGSIFPAVDAFRIHNKSLPLARMRNRGIERDLTLVDGMCFYKSSFYDLWTPIKWLFVAPPEHDLMPSWIHVRSPIEGNLFRFYDNPKEAFVACAVTAAFNSKATISLDDIRNTPVGKELTYARVAFDVSYLSDRVEWMWEKHVEELGDATEEEIENWMSDMEC